MIAALSGGVDSVVLLDALDALKRDLDFHLAALHVNHHLSPPSSEWAAFCRSVCGARNVPVEIVDVEVAAGASQEAKARARRYDVFRRQDTDFVVLAHSLDDQVETVLLRLLRGAGAHGLAGMRMLRTGLWTQDSGLSKSGLRTQDLGLSGEDLESLSPQSSVLSPCPRILRPLLDIPRFEILAYARERGLEWMEDESNSDTRFDRNFLRQHVSPLIAERWPAYRQVIARAARNLAESAELLDELAAVDVETCAIDEAIDVARLKRLSRARAANLLRCFLWHHGVLMPDRAWLEEALSQLLDSRQDARACIALDQFALRRYHGTIHLVKSAPAYDRDFRVTWRGESELQLPDGILRFSRAAGKGISLAHLQASEVTIRFRKGGERFCPDGKRPRRSLKNLLQENAIPPWDRERLPLLFGGDKLVWAAGIGVDAAFQCTPREEGLVLLWRR